MNESRPFCVAICASLVLLTASCKDKEGATGSSGAAGSAAPAAAGKAAVPADVCKLFSAAEVSAILNEKVEPKAVPGGGCQFPGGTAKSLYPTISVAEDTPGAGGIDGAKAGAQAVTGGTATPITVGGAAGYVVTGRMGNSASTQAAVAKKGLLVTVTVSGGEKASNEKIVQDILKLAVAKL